jgi:hypothetical protein
MTKNFYTAAFQACQPSAGKHVPAKHFEAGNLHWVTFPGILFKYLPANEKTRLNWPGFEDDRFGRLYQADSTLRR